MKKIIIVSMTLFTLLLASYSVQARIPDPIGFEPDPIFLTPDPLQTGFYDGLLENEWVTVDSNRLPGFAGEIIPNYFVRTCFAGICINRWQSYNIYGLIYDYGVNLADKDYFMFTIPQYSQVFINLKIIYSNTSLTSFYSSISGYTKDIDNYNFVLEVWDFSTGSVVTSYSSSQLSSGIYLSAGDYYLRVTASDPSYNGEIYVNGTHYVEFYGFNVVYNTI